MWFLPFITVEPTQTVRPTNIPFNQNDSALSPVSKQSPPPTSPSIDSIFLAVQQIWIMRILFLVHTPQI